AGGVDVKSRSAAQHMCIICFPFFSNNTAPPEIYTLSLHDALPIFVELDVTSTASVTRAFEAVSAHGPVDVLVNNAGIGGAAPLELTPEDEHRRMFETNYFGAIRCIQAVLPAMRAERRGTIVNVTSIAGLVATPNQIAYSASKWALECAGEALAHEVRRFGVRVVNV